MNLRRARSAMTGVGRTLTVPRLMVLAVLGLLSMTGTEPGARSTDLAASRASTERPVPEQAYLQAARLHGALGSDGALLNTARNACAELNSGGDVRWVANDVARRDDIGDTDAHAVLRAAVHTYCPVHGG